ncbi:hypothetical protein COLO4_37406 [Corchorus olitorius]|uniref:Uncharacterized protein n=1 Tax=Corchorus olitorius TaxID=93759 RepID=A0A1R3G228_9ROSI|nr:hypothetical protein COLO4_37406 [Corchorus olitorius]
MKSLANFLAKARHPPPFEANCNSEFRDSGYTLMFLESRGRKEVQAKINKGMVHLERVVGRKGSAAVDEWESWLLSWLFPLKVRLSPSLLL